MSIHKSLGIAIIITIVLAMGFGFFGYQAYGDKQKREQKKIEQKKEFARIDAEAKAAAEADTAKQELLEKEQANKVFQSNKESLHHKGLELEARLALTDDQDRLIRELVEENFTNYNDSVVAKAGSMIHRIGGESATKIVLEYKNDPRVVVQENVKWWYKQYSPGAMDDRIEKLEVKHHITAIENPPTAPKVETDNGVRKPTPAVKTTRPTIAPKAKAKVSSADEQEKQEQLKDNLEHISYIIADKERMLRNVQQDIMTSQCKDPAVKADRRAQVRTLQEIISSQRAKLAEMQAQLK